MPVPFSAALRRVAAFALAAAAIGLAKGAEQPDTAPAAASSPAASDASIETAKRDFDLLKSGRDQGGQAKPVMPKIAAPELGSTPPAVAPSRSSATKRIESGAKPANWLVDAMQKARDGDEPRAVRDPFEPQVTSTKSPDQKEAERGSTKSDRESEEKDAAGLNPLAPYLAQWMTPQDYALLGARILRAAEGDAAPGSPSSRGFIPGGSGSGGANGPFDSAIALVPPPSPNVAPPLENPYLHALNAPPPAPPRPASTAAAGAPAPVPPPSVSLPVTTVAPPKAVAPNLLKTQTDEKYFKPLKRF